MKSLLNPIFILLAVTLVLTACSKAPKRGAQDSELEAKVQKLTAVQPESGREAVEQALAAIRERSYVGAVARLRAAKQNPQLSGEQRFALDEAIRAVNADLTARALRGDQEASTNLQAIARAMSR